MMRKKESPIRTCGDCIHEYACAMWNIGNIHNTNATNCTNYTTVKDSAPYLCGKMDERKASIDVSDDFFGTILNCAVRYAIGRQSYMPRLVVDFITPLIPRLSGKTLWCFDKDITDQKYCGGYGDPKIDEPLWMRFHEAVRAERTKRGEEFYKSWRESEGNDAYQSGTGTL